MTRSSLIRIVLGCAGALGVLLLGAGIRQVTIPVALEVVTGCALAGGAASLGWHGIAALFDRPEEPAPDGRHRARPRPAGGMERRPSAAAEPPSHDLRPSAVDARTPAARVAENYDPYLAQSADDWPDLAPAHAGDREDLYAHPSAWPA